MEEAGLEWNSALTAAVTMATDEGIKKDSEEISGTFLCSSCIPRVACVLLWVYDLVYAQSRRLHKHEY